MWTRGWWPSESQAWDLVGGTAPLQTVCAVIAGAGHPCVGCVALFAKVQEAALALFAFAIIKSAADFLH